MWPRAIIFTSLLLAVSAFAQNESGSEGTNFQGYVRYQDNSPAQFVPVELWTDGESTWRTTLRTDRQGRFRTGTPCMVIQYRVALPGYQPVYGRADISTNPCRTLVDLTLRALPQTVAAGMIDARIAGIPSEARREFEEGQDAIKANQFERAIPRLLKAVDLYPKYAEAYQLLGVAQLQLHHGPEAEASLTKAIAIEDKMPRAQYLLGMLYAMTGRVNQAEKPFERFAELDPKNPDAHFELAKVDFALSRFPEAEARARKAIELKETNSGVHIVLGYALLRQNKPDLAQEEFERFLKQEPNSPMAGEVQNTLTEIARGKEAQHSRRRE